MGAMSEDHDLVAWFAGQLGAEAKFARAASRDQIFGSEWRAADDQGYVSSVDGGDTIAVGPYGCPLGGPADHIAWQDPRTTCARVTACSRLIAEFRSAADWADHLRASGSVENLREAEASARHAGAMLHAIRILAEAYEAKAGYREEWRPV